MHTFKFIFFSLFLFVVVLPFSQVQDALENRIQVKTKEGTIITYYNHSYALMVGMSDYTNGWPDLPDIVRDLIKVRNALEKHGFEVEVIENPTKVQLQKALEEFMFTHGIDEDSRLLFYFKGHGYSMEMPYGGKIGVVVPVDAPLPY